MQSAGSPLIGSSGHCATDLHGSEQSVLACSSHVAPASARRNLPHLDGLVRCSWRTRAQGDACCAEVWLYVYIRCDSSGGPRTQPARRWAGSRNERRMPKQDWLPQATQALPRSPQKSRNPYPCMVNCARHFPKTYATWRGSGSCGCCCPQVE